MQLPPGGSRWVDFGVNPGRASASQRGHSKVVDECLQFFGGYGYMLEYPISRAFMDARVQRIYAGTNEIMNVIIAKQLGL
ncbi:acyl-CoA dehydrogenase family protein [Archangium lansingense]|uniref:acyl-CoA dehydrogenase family protein n=1 Tax=Archangium lansingense TaxID=2995310 RepID=UPI00280AAAD0|nr:acyl-CoA dehydrogenase family protein [Archangium lansinium]